MFHLMTPGQAFGERSAGRLQSNKRSTARTSVLGQYRIIGQERFASKFCVLTRRGFALSQRYRFTSRTNDNSPWFMRYRRDCMMKSMIISRWSVKPFLVVERIKKCLTRQLVYFEFRGAKALHFLRILSTLCA